MEDVLVESEHILSEKHSDNSEDQFSLGSPFPHSFNLPFTPLACSCEYLGRQRIYFRRHFLSINIGSISMQIPLRLNNGPMLQRKKIFVYEELQSHPKDGFLSSV